MAKKNRESADQGNQESKRSSNAGPPAGYKKRSSVQAEGWVRKAPGVTVHGLIMGRFPKADAKDQFFYQIKLYNEVEIQIAGGELVVAEPGTVVNLDENGNLKALRMAMEEGDSVVWCQYLEKKRQRKDPSKTFWDIDVQTSDEEMPL